MAIPIRVLILEDNPADAELVVAALRQNGYEPEWSRVDNETDYLAQLVPALDLVLADYSLPQFNGLEALKLLQDTGLDLPLIIVTGTLGDELAAECVRRGASDLVLKDRLQRLSLAVQSALEQKKQRDETRRIEAALRESEELYRAVVENAHDAIAINVDTERVFVNRAFLELVGVERSEVGRISVGQFVVPEDREMVVQRSLARQRGEPVEETYEYQVLRSDGQRRTVQASAVAINYKDQPASMAILRDVSDYKRAEAELQALFNISSILGQPGTYEDKLNNVMQELARVGEVDWVTLRRFNAETQGLDLIASAGQGALDLPPLSAIYSTREGLAFEAFNSGEMVVVNDYQNHPWASRVIVDLGMKSTVMIPILAQDRTIGMINFISRGINHFTPERIQLLKAIGDGLGVLLENARLYQEITLREELERRRDTFVSVASHELRTPMTSIVGFSELLLNRDPPESTRRQWLQYIYTESQRLAGIVDDLLNVSRIQSGRLAINLEHLRLRESVEGVLAAITSTSDLHEFQTEIPEGTPEVEADRDKLSQVLINLVSNAVKYSPDGGVIKISAQSQSDRHRVVVGVSDQGIGISSEDQENLFTVFHRIHRPETEGIRGSGLGLYIVSELTKLMGGEVWLESGLGEGSTFFFSIPTGEL